MERPPMDGEKIRDLARTVAREVAADEWEKQTAWRIETERTLQAHTELLAAGGRVMKDLQESQAQQTRLLQQISSNTEGMQSLELNARRGGRIIAATARALFWTAKHFGPVLGFGITAWALWWAIRHGGKPPSMAGE